MKKLISFYCKKKLPSLYIGKFLCTEPRGGNDCIIKDCPIWKKLKPASGKRGRSEQ